jgi:hypothetical protein
MLDRRDRDARSERRELVLRVPAAILRPGALAVRSGRELRRDFFRLGLFVSQLAELPQ